MLQMHVKLITVGRHTKLEVSVLFLLSPNPVTLQYRLDITAEQNFETLRMI